MSEKLNVGLEAKAEVTVNSSNTAIAYGSGGVEVFATPAMIALMENAAMVCVAHLLNEGQATVGTHLDVKHIAATPLGMKVEAKAQLIAIDGKKLTFNVEAYDETERIGEGTHERYIINTDKFMGKVRDKAGSR